jgi:hypothetical protein
MKTIAKPFDIGPLYRAIVESDDPGKF